MIKELKQSDILVFKEDSGSGSFVKVEMKGNYFMPAKKGLRLEGKSKPIRKYEKFTYIDYEVLKRETPRVLRMSLLRQSTGEKCFISETDLFKYFAYSPDQTLDSRESSIDD